MKTFKFVFFFSIMISSQIFGQTIDSLKQKIQELISTKNAIVGVSIIGENDKDLLSLNEKEHFPMQSVFKFPIAIAMLSEIDNSKFSLDQKIIISKKELDEDTWSPIKDKYPNGATLSLSEIIKYTLGQSDNIGCDILIRLLGGTKRVEQYYRNINFSGISIKATEKEMHKSWNTQFENWITPESSNELLKIFYSNKKKLLSEKSYRFLWKIMVETQTGKKSLRGGLPSETVIAHKTGSSGTNSEGITAAVNDIGIIFLPNGKHFFISVYITNSKENSETNEKIISEIAKLTWNYFTD